jgi:hypothetical protein
MSRELTVDMCQSHQFGGWNIEFWSAISEMLPTSEYGLAAGERDTIWRVAEGIIGLRRVSRRFNNLDRAR